MSNINFDDNIPNLEEIIHTIILNFTTIIIVIAAIDIFILIIPMGNILTIIETSLVCVYKFLFIFIFILRDPFMNVHFSRTTHIITLKQSSFSLENYSLAPGVS